MIDLNEIGSKFKFSIKILFIDQGRGYIFLITFLITLMSLNYVKSEFTKLKFIFINSKIIYSYVIMVGLNNILIK